MNNVIWCLFSIANEYDQPANNLECWWSKKPSIETIANTLNLNMSIDDEVVTAANIFCGEEKRISGKDYRIESIAEGDMV